MEQLTLHFDWWSFIQGFVGHKGQAFHESVDPRNMEDLLNQEEWYGMFRKQ